MAVIKINTPPTLQSIRRVQAGDEVVFTGRVMTARDRAHRWLLEHDFKPLHGAVLYHCGPMYRQTGKTITILAAGPTTSARFNHFTPQLIKQYNIRAILGKGGMNETVRRAFIGQGMYCAAIGGAAVYYAHCITEVVKVYKTDFGMTDAIWELAVKNFPVVCMMDSRGRSLFQEVETASTAVYQTFTT
ncbi:MAG: fumarate hydratase C-terminal domain-containing protein [Candidatus Kerfeldbacteria bacterium]|nr:fumarate hydratase C-terminal domain-containing protein [Candidatus Kerfeldbacteria bacterium]